jgi:hypothetical protein
MNHKTSMFAFFGEQKAFTAFLSTMIFIGSIGAVFTARSASATTGFKVTSDTISDSRVGVPAVQTVEFTPVATSTGDIVLSYASTSAFTFGALTASDITMSTGTTVAVGSSCSGVSYQFSTNQGLGTMTLHPCLVGVKILPLQAVTIVIGGTNKITNPGSVGSYKLTIADTTTQQSQSVIIAIIDDTLMSAAVEPVLDFTVSGVNTSASVFGDNPTTNTTASTINFGTIASGAPYLAAQQLAVKTNAINGFTVTAWANSPFQSANGSVINAYKDKDPSSVPQDWSSWTPDINDNTTWGYVGMSTDDTTSFPEFSGNKWQGDFFTTPVPVLASARPTDGVTAGIANVGYKVEITDLQAAATDYQTHVIYVATPKF